jgi:hypothetical protein
VDTPPVWGLLTACPILMTFVMRVLHKIFPTSYKFCANQHGVNYSLSAVSTLTVRVGRNSLKKFGTFEHL